MPESVPRPGSTPESQLVEAEALVRSTQIMLEEHEAKARCLLCHRQPYELKAIMTNNAISALTCGQKYCKGYIPEGIST